MKKRMVTIVLLSLVMVLSVYANGAEDSSAADGKAVLKMWSKGSGTDPAMEAVVEAFRAANPDTELTYESYGENYANVVNLALASGDAPDIFENGGNFPVQTLAAQGLIAPIDDVFTEELKSQMFQPLFTQKDNVYNGQRYTIPTRISAFRLLYNKDLFKAAGLNPDQPPKTLAEVREYAAKITAAGKGDFYGFGLYLGSSNIWTRVIDPICTAAGTSADMGYDFNTGKFDFTANMEVLSELAEIAKDGSLFPGYETLAVDPMRANFAQGKVGMYFDGNWTSGTFATQIKTDIDWATAAVPVSTGDTYGLGACFPAVDFAVSASSKYQDQAKSFLRFLLSNAAVMQQEKPEPKTFLPANEASSLPIEAMNLKGTEYNFKLDDLAPMPQIVYYSLSLEGDKRDIVFTDIFLKLVNGGKVDTAKTIQTLNDRYNSALDKALADGLLSESDIHIADFDFSNR